MMFGSVAALLFVGLYLFIGFIGFDDFAVADEEAGEKHDVDYHLGDIVHMGVALQTIVADPKC